MNSIPAGTQPILINFMRTVPLLLKSDTTRKSRYICYFADIVLTTLDTDIIHLDIILIYRDIDPVNLYRTLPTLDINLLFYDRTFTTYKITSPTKVGNYIRMAKP